MNKSYDFLLFIFLLFFGTLIVAFVASIWIPYKQKRNYIKMEISRSTDKEREYWKRALKEFYIGNIPIIGKIILKNYRK